MEGNWAVTKNKKIIQYNEGVIGNEKCFRSSRNGKIPDNAYWKQ